MEKKIIRIGIPHTVFSGNGNGGGRKFLIDESFRKIKSEMIRGGLVGRALSGDTINDALPEADDTKNWLKVRKIFSRIIVSVTRITSNEISIHVK